jgi:hypothetical protein
MVGVVEWRDFLVDGSVEAAARLTFSRSKRWPLVNWVNLN